VAGAGGPNGLGKCGERTDVKHGVPWNFWRDYRPAPKVVKAGLGGAFNQAAG
jgi:hypothetical protein